MNLDVAAKGECRSIWVLSVKDGSLCDHYFSREKSRWNKQLRAEYGTTNANGDADEPA